MPLSQTDVYRDCLNTDYDGSELIELIDARLMGPCGGI